MSTTITIDLDALASSYLPTTYTTSRVYLEDFPGVTEAQTALISELNVGTVLTSYLGHGSATKWA